MAATALLAPPADGPSVQVIDGALRIDRFITTDPDVVALVNTATDARAAVHSALSTGARVLGLAQARLDTTLVEQAFGHLH